MLFLKTVETHLSDFATFWFSESLGRESGSNLLPSTLPAAPQRPSTCSVLSKQHSCFIWICTCLRVELSVLVRRQNRGQSKQKVKKMGKQREPKVKWEKTPDVWKSKVCPLFVSRKLQLSSPGWHLLKEIWKGWLPAWSARHLLPHCMSSQC